MASILALKNELTECDKVGVIPVKAVVERDERILWKFRLYISKVNTKTKGEVR
jgi:hypothetical protein